MKNIFVKLSVVAALALSGVAQANPAPYTHVGTENSEVYTFTAASTGMLTGYFAGSTAVYENDLTMLVNGVATNVHGLNNKTSFYGESFNFGPVVIGDVLVFVLTNITPGGIGPWYSQTNLNSDLVNHVFSSNYAGDPLLGAGTYVSFEDLDHGGNFNYDDISFVFSNLRVDVPEPASLALMGLGILGIALNRRRKGLVAK